MAQIYEHEPQTTTTTIIIIIECRIKQRGYDLVVVVLTMLVIE